MKGLIIFLVILLCGAIVTDQWVRAGLPEPLLAEEVWCQINGESGVRTLCSGLSGVVAGARFDTDADGWRNPDPEWGVSAQPSKSTEPTKAMRVLVVGGELTAGLGLQAHELFPHRLEQILRKDFQWPHAVVLAKVLIGNPREKTRHILSLLEQLKPDRLILEITPGDCGVDDTPYYLVSDASDAVHNPLPPVPRKSASGLWSYRAWTDFNHQRALREQRIEQLLVVDGVASRATQNARQWLIEWDPVAAGSGEQVDPFSRELLWDRYHPKMIRSRLQARGAYSTLLAEVKRRGIAVAAVFHGPAFLVAPIREALDELAAPSLMGVPFHLDPAVRVGSGIGRPAAAVHGVIADVLAAKLAEERFFIPADRAWQDAVGPERSKVAKTLWQFHGNNIGFERSFTEQATRLLHDRGRFAGSILPLEVLDGAEAGGRLTGDRPLVLLTRTHPKQELVLEFEIEGQVDDPAGIQVRWFDRHGEGKSMVDVRRREVEANNSSTRVKYSLQFSGLLPRIACFEIEGRFQEGAWRVVQWRWITPSDETH